ncbi:unnamed protein product [Hermetia illucens]|uniref:Protein lava lamp n=1 Tax=Hermetia illucens TaxID=343691 RepID=A0A7R8UYW4_HERIL|nr:protein lava lamp [Hermetia illucens]XP_037920956.1 protein lava lamp [Hermetia illucens]XP_037920957.1 protein lava lamp [Hermetia illucens]CAD7089685.1 unnamed protein product [Hermetia illucens]
MSTGDPGAVSGPGGQEPISNLQETMNRQQEKISALKELVRKSEAAHGKSTTSAQEKVKNIAKRLSHIKSKARSRQNLDSSLSELKDEPIFEETPVSSPAPQKARSETPGSEKIQLLRRQVEESKIKMAERENSKREIEERVTQLKAKFDSTQQSLERSSELGRSMGDLSILSPGSVKEKFKSATDLSFTPLNLDKEKIKFLENRIKLLEKQIEKQGNTSTVSEPEAVTTLKNRILDLEENLREKECIIEARTQAVSLMSESLSAKTATTVDTLEETRLEMQKMQQTFVESENTLREQIRSLQDEIAEKDLKIRNLEEVNDILETARFELTVKNADLESKLEGVQEYTKLDELNKLNETLQHKITTLEEQLTEKTVECNVLNANFSVLQEKLKSTAPKSLFSNSGDEEAGLEIKKLKDQLDEANKSMIKIKLKSKQLQKQVDKFKKMSDANSEVIRLSDENQELQMKIAELEEEKGSLQLKLLSGGSEIEKMDESELAKKIQVLETTCQNQTSAIQLLEEQKLELQTTNQELESLRDQIQQTERQKDAEVASQIESIELEEREDKYILQTNKLTADCEQLRSENQKLQEEIHRLEDEKQELQKKVDHYIAENIELLDKVEKLSKSSSSAESIEIVERLTHQEKLEMEEFNKKVSAHEESEAEAHSKEKADDQPDTVMGQELSDSLVKLREESSELMHRIELFTKERREVLGKMEILTSENQELLKQIDELKAEKATVEDLLTKTKLEIVVLEDKLDTTTSEKIELQKEFAESTELKAKLEDELNALSQAKHAASNKAFYRETIDQCSESLSQMTAELENYRKSNDKSTRLNASKKLAKEAKNACQQFSDLLEKLRTSENIGKEADESAVDAELKRKLVESEATIESLQGELKASIESLAVKDAQVVEINKKLNSALGDLTEGRLQHQTELSALENIRKELEAKLGAADNEINILKTLVAEQKQQLIEAFTEHEIELNAKLAEIEKYEKQVSGLQSELNLLQNENAKSNETFNAELKEEIKKLENALSANQKLIADQSADLQNKQDTIETLNAQIMELYRTMEENSAKVAEKDDEITYLQELLEANKTENEALAKENEENKSVIEKLLLELHANRSSGEKTEMLADLERQNDLLDAKVKTLEKTNLELEAKNKEQVEKLKKFAANLKKKSIHCTELETKLKEVNSSPQTASSSIAEQEDLVKNLRNEVHQYQAQINALRAATIPKQEADSLKNEITSLKKERDSALEQCRALASECESLKTEVTQYKSKVEYFERSINEVHGLVDVLHKDTNMKEDEIQRLRKELELSQNESRLSQEKLHTISEELKSKTLKFEKSKSVIKEKNREIHRLTGELEDLQKKSTVPVAEVTKEDNTELSQLREEYQKLAQTYDNERETFQQTITRLETLYDGIQAKFQENTGYIESLETENNNYKEKIIKLENCIAAFEERRQSLERKTDMLDAQLQEKTDEYERNEDALIYRLNMLLDHDDVIGKRLIEAQEAKEELAEKMEHLCGENAELQLQLSKAEKDLDTYKHEHVDRLTAENESLQEQLENVRSEISRQQNIYEGRLAQKHAEIDELENDLSVQLSNINQEKRKLQESLEKAQDEINELKDENVRLKESANSLEQIRSDLEREMTWVRMQNDNMTQDQYELQEMRMQVMQDKTEIENLKHQLESVVQSHEIEMNGLREQIKELDSVRMQVGQNQTDDQVFIENENKRLKEQLTEKEAAIENYQKENLKLQMASMVAGLSAPPDTFPAAAQSGDLTVLETANSEAMFKEKVKSLEEEVNKLQSLLAEKDQIYNASVQDVQVLQEQLAKSQQELSELRTELQKPSFTHSTAPAAPPPNNFFATTSDSNSIFDELITAHHVGELGQGAGQPDQKKIEDLERNVSDLEKYANELENKLKNLTAIHENTLIQLQDQVRRYDEAVKSYEERIKEYEDKQKELEVQKNIESMIVTENLATEPVPSLNLFFNNAPQQPASEFDRLVQGSGNATAESNPVPVVEEVIVPKKAYLLYPEATEATAIDTEEGWGWGSEEAALEERHQNEMMQSKSNENAQISEYKNRIDELELERSRSDERVIELQVKCGKLMKKLKEYKLRLDQAESEKAFRKSTSIDSSDLDLAIQDELKSQVKSLEEKASEMKKLQEKESAEKQNLLKRIDVLTSANERMTEMKERQDIEVEGLQVKIRQLSQQLKQLEEWGERDDSNRHQVETTTTATTQTVEHKELQVKLKTTLQELEDLKVDRDELQALLDDERENVRISENKIKELKEKLETAETTELVSTATQNEVEKLKLDLENQQVRLSEKEAELSNAAQMNQNFQFQLNDYQATIGQLSTESDSIKSQLGKLQNEYLEKVNENAQLSEDVRMWMEKCNTFAEEIEALKVNSEIRAESSQTSDTLEEKVQDLTSQVQYKEAEILHLKQKVQDLMQEDQTQLLVQEILTKNQEIVQLRMQVQQLESDKVELENNLSKQLTEEMAQRSTRSTDDSQEKIKVLEKELEDMKQEKQQMETELQVLNNHVMNSLANEDRMKEILLELDTKNLELTELKSTLETMKQQQITTEGTSTKTQPDADVEARIAEVNRVWEQTVEQKCSEIAESWRQYMDQRETEFKQLENNLNLQIEQLRAGIVVPKPKTPEEIELESETVDSETLQKMRSVMEQQELEIVTLKEQLAMRSAEYARLAARHDPYALSTSSNLSFEPRTQRKLSTSSSGMTAGSDQPGVVPKSELDLALYMLHQRDMRCEELTLELVSLLEERDTLQLKLSNSLRQIEEIKQKSSYLESGSESDQASSNANSPEKSTKPKPVGGAETDQQSDNLNSKISQLQSVGYAKDKRIREEREQRQRQMEKIQQDVANIPSEAVSELVGSNLSNTVQSPSNVLLDWLWGKNNSQQS